MQHLSIEFFYRSSFNVDHSSKKAYVPVFDIGFFFLKNDFTYI